MQQGAAGDKMKQMTPADDGRPGMIDDGNGNARRCRSGGVSKKDMKMLTRTDFLLQFVWVPR